MSGGVSYGPKDHCTVTLACTTSSGARTIRQALGGHFQQLRITNAGTDSVFIRFGASGIVATAPSGATEGDFIMLPSTTEIFTTNQTTLAAICPTSTATLYITLGEGGP